MKDNAKLSWDSWLVEKHLEVLQSSWPGHAVRDKGLAQIVR